LRLHRKTRNNKSMSQDTPCIAVCKIDPRTNLCFGCGRTLPEIARWGQMTAEERRALMAELPERMDAAGLPPMSGCARGE
jgi:predicted Fe-S protein YdhL (DUF1289 family)